MKWEWQVPERPRRFIDYTQLGEHAASKGPLARRRESRIAEEITGAIESTGFPLQPSDHVATLTLR
jgi:hypothetical protein